MHDLARAAAQALAGLAQIRPGHCKLRLFRLNLTMTPNALVCPMQLVCMVS